MKFLMKSLWFKRLLKISFVIFLLLNVISIFHAYKFTHFAEETEEKTKTATKLTTLQKMSTLLFGVNNPRPVNEEFPKRAYTTIQLHSNKTIECWHITLENALGSVILFHGYGSSKSKLLDKSEVFNSLGYNTLIVDFMGSGGSEGNQTTIGYMESEQVKTCFDYLYKNQQENIFLFGSSMGAVAIMKALNDYEIKPRGIILECPFGTMYQTVCARFELMNAPTFPLAGMLVFWGGVINGFWAFGHNPSEYAKHISCPTLLQYGAQDEKVSRKEIDEIHKNLAGEKLLVVYPNAGHSNYLTLYQDAWTKNVGQFLDEYK